MLSVRVGVSGVLCHLDSSNDTTGHDDGYFGLFFFLMFSRWHTIFTGREHSAQYDAVMWNESCS